MNLVVICTRRGVEAGLEWKGVFTNFAVIASGKKARYQGFSNELRRIEAGAFAAIRYTDASVGEQTGLGKESAMAFIAAHPPDDD
jgi:hypothetical protein